MAGSGMETSTDNPEHLLSNYDLVFAKARCALEAMAAGAAVVLCDKTGLGSMVSMSEVAPASRLEFRHALPAKEIDFGSSHR